MKLGSEEQVAFSNPRPPALDAVLSKLDELSLKPGFVLQREVALRRALKPYLESGTGPFVAPLPEESQLATLNLFCDFYPEDGQLTLIEQLRDVITEHIPEEERLWLDPLKHSYLDLLELTESPRPSTPLLLRSIGDGAAVTVPGGEFARSFRAGHVLLTRVVRDPASQESGQGWLAGCGLALSPADAETLYEQARDWERDIEMTSGSLALGEWQEFAKRFGHILLWAFAELRFSALVDAVGHIQYRTADGQPYLYAIALYDQHEYQTFVEGLSAMSELQAEATAVSDGRVPPTRTWRQRVRDDVVAKLTLTSSQLIVECDNAERLDHIKHRLAASFGFSLHFRGESLMPPARPFAVSELMRDQPLTLVVTPEEDRALINQFLEKAYLEWTDQPHRFLGGQTPRHAAASAALRSKVSSLIDEMERNDPSRLRHGAPAFEYNRLRAHVGLDEVAR
jgi:hypothetical protein